MADIPNNEQQRCRKTHMTYEETLNAELDLEEAEVAVVMWAERHPTLVRTVPCG